MSPKSCQNTLDPNCYIRPEHREVLDGIIKNNTSPDGNLNFQKALAEVRRVKNPLFIERRAFAEYALAEKELRDTGGGNSLVRGLEDAAAIQVRQQALDEKAYHMLTMTADRAEVPRPGVPLYIDSKRPKAVLR